MHSIEFRVQTEAPYVPRVRTEAPLHFRENDDEWIARMMNEHGSRLVRMVRELKNEREQLGLTTNFQDMFMSQLSNGGVIAPQQNPMLN